MRLRRYAFRLAAGAAAVFTVATTPALATDQVHDEIQVYNAEIAQVGQWTYEQHLNYALVGQTQPEVPGGFFSNHSLQGTPEFAYGVTDWWEPGFYLPFAINGAGEFLSDGAKIRSLFVVPDAAKSRSGNFLSSNESDVIPYWALDSFGSARCGSLNTAVLRIATAFVIRVI